MKILWLCAFKIPNTPGINRKTVVTGGWVQSMLEELELFNKIEQIDIVTVTNEKKKISYSQGKIKYTLLPSKRGVMKFDPKLYKLLEREINQFNPDIIDVQGIEFYLVRSLLQIETKIPIVATIQGLTSEYYKHYYAGISCKNLIVNRTLRNNAFFDGSIEKRYKYKKRGINEIETLSKIKYVLGRTRWDYVNTIKYNPDLRYFVCKRNLRNEFYEQKWNINHIEKYSLFTTQARYPIKGLHLLLRAVYILKKKYPEIKLYVGGKNMIKRDSLKEKLTFNDYQKYLFKLIKKYNIENNIFFAGFLDASNVVKMLLKTHVFILPSVIENSPNALGEAQIVGTPAVAGLVGGNADYIKDGETGLLYNAYEPAMLADKIEQIFNSDKLAIRLSINERKDALKRHDRTKNANDLLNAYIRIINDQKDG